MQEKLQEIRREITSQIDTFSSSKALYEFRKTFLDNKEGKISLLMKGLKDVPKEDRPAVGKAINEVKEWALQLFEETEQKEYVPEFIESKGEVSGTTRGNAYHRIMELMDFSQVPNFDIIWQDMERLAEGKVLDPLYLSLVRKEKLEAFLQSDLAERMKKAQNEKKLYREQPFVYGLEASRLDENFPKEEKVLIQGIVDAYFEEDGELVIVDYKTDAIHHPEELIARYKEQLKYYKEALEKLTAKKVKELVLYSYALNQSVKVEVE